MIFNNKGKTYHFEWRSLIVNVIAFISLLGGLYSEDIQLTILAVLLAIYDAIRFPYPILREIIFLDGEGGDDDVHPEF